MKAYHFEHCGGISAMLRNGDVFRVKRIRFFGAGSEESIKLP